MSVFNTKDQFQIFEDMKNSMLSKPGNKITDFREGSIITILLFAVAEEIENFQNETVTGWKPLVEWSIYEIYKDFIARKDASFASGTVIFVKSDDSGVITIPLNTLVGTGGVNFTTTQTVTFTTSESPPVPIVATESGVIGNVNTNDINVLVDELPDILYCYNPVSTSGGASEESLKSFQERFADWLKSLYRTNNHTIKNYALQVAGVSSVGIKEHYPSRGINTIYIDDGSGSASEELLTSVKEILEGDLVIEGGVKPAGVQYLYSTPGVIYINIDTQLTFDYGSNPTDVSVEVENVITEYLNNKPIGEGYIYSELNYLIQSVDNVSSVKVLIPEHDIDIEQNQIIRVQTISVKSY